MVESDGRWKDWKNESNVGEKEKLGKERTKGGEK
jgi:hypothetical protein